MKGFASQPERAFERKYIQALCQQCQLNTDPNMRTKDGHLFATHAPFCDFLMHETRFVFQSEAMGSGNGRITAEERSDTEMPWVSGYSVLKAIIG